MSKKIDKYLNEAVANIREDRDVTKELLDDILKYLSKDEKLHKDVGVIASKSVESLQRSNEQLVKIASLKQKSQKEDNNLSAEERDEIFNQFQNSGDDE